VASEFLEGKRYRDYKINTKKTGSREISVIISTRKMVSAILTQGGRWGRLPAGELHSVPIGSDTCSM
jgi:hypothetical protein